MLLVWVQRHRIHTHGTLHEWNIIQVKPSQANAFGKLECQMFRAEEAGRKGYCLSAYREKRDRLDSKTHFLKAQRLTIPSSVYKINRPKPIKFKASKVKKLTFKLIYCSIYLRKGNFKRKSLNLLDQPLQSSYKIYCIWWF